MRPEHEAANAALSHWPDKAAMRKALQAYDRAVKLIAGDLVKRQMLMFEFEDYRYFGWCTVRPGNDKRTEDKERR
ncbi:hypothetical protein [uncultured Amphritea sp.]|uniref:hypothetical protein n=1 Tax=uncultured Amphritea sp. TaxID=981605 RepID=UPI0026059CF2|nr:hypothetical protein [uncultured Amphritea sp.]